jgi:phosphoribosyl 1,2-cyclic phosphodiesterase
MRVTSLGSGSSGNAFLVEAGPQGRTRLLIDAGFSLRTLKERLHLVGVTPGQLQGVLVTHEHSDHILGLPVLMKYHHIPVSADAGTLKALREIFTVGTLLSESGKVLSLETITGSTGKQAQINEEMLLAQAATTKIEEGLWRPLQPNEESRIGDIEIRPFPVPHDAVAPRGYLLQAGGCRVCLITDSGEVTPVMLEAMKQADLLILESNHDRARLLGGPYPYHLKQRILSPTGHLSNAQAAEAVLRIWRSDGLRWLWLAHLSRTNNTPKLALASMQTSLRQAGANLAQIHISVLGRELGKSWDSTQLWQAPHLWEM